MSPALRLVAAVAIGVAALSVPAQAAAPAPSPAVGYSPGDVVARSGVSVIVPVPGRAVTLVVDRVGGDSTTLSVSTDLHGVVTVDDSTPVRTAEPAVAPAKCDDSAYTLLNGAAWEVPYDWHFRTASTPNELTVAEARRALKASVANITTARNACGLADEVSASSVYGGSTTSPSDVSSQASCAATPNYLNVTEFGAISGGGILAATCTYSTGPGGDIVAASVRINTAFEWWVSGACTGAYGLKAVQTHEYGHGFGVGHVDEATHGNLTMSTNINGTCSNFEATLGRGDVLALRSLY